MSTSPQEVEGSPQSLLNSLRLGHDQRTQLETQKRKPWIVVAAALLLVLLAAGAWYWWTHGRRMEVEAVTAVAPDNHGGSKAILQGIGYVTARRQATVSAQVTGTLTKVMIEEGERVAAGQVLAQLDDTAQRATLAQTAAQVKASAALLVQVQAQLDQARRDLQRSEGLIDKHLVSQESLETAATQVAMLESQVTAQAKRVEASRAAQQGADVQLAYTTVRAPFAGVVTAKAAQEGEIVSPISAGGGFTRTGVGTIVDMDSLEIEVDVNEAYINRVAAQQPVEAVLDAYPGWTIPAHVIAIVPTADRSKATVKVRIAIDQKDPRILPDMGVRVSFLEEKAAAADTPPPRGVLVPASSIVDRGERLVVFAIDGGRVHQVAVSPGVREGDLQFVEGVPNGTKVVRIPPNELTDGTRVVLKR